MKTSGDDSQELELAWDDPAADWAVRRADGLTPAEEARFQAWLAADPRHYAGYAEAELALGVLAPRRDAQARRALRDELAEWETRRRMQRMRRRTLAFATMGLAAAAAVVGAFFPRESADVFVAAATASAPAAMSVRPPQQTLADGSIVQLNAAAKIATEFSPEVRRVRLVRGEAHFAVAKDPARPFVVSVGSVEVRALGTEFNVRFKPDTVEVLVTEGKVRVSGEARGDSPAEAAAVVTADATDAADEASATGRRDTDVAAGYRTVVPLMRDATQAPICSAVSAVSPEEIRRELAWREMRFELSNATLAEAVSLFNQRSRVQLEIGDASLRERRLSGIFRADNPAQFAELIEATLDIKAVPEGGERIVFRRE